MAYERVKLTSCLLTENELHVTDTDQSITDVEAVLGLCTTCVVQNKQVHAVGRMHSFILSRVTRSSRLLCCAV